MAEYKFETLQLHVGQEQARNNRYHNDAGSEQAHKGMEGLFRRLTFNGLIMK